MNTKKGIGKSFIIVTLLFLLVPLVLAQCEDGLDNDGDGLVDSQDVGCVNNGDASESYYGLQLPYSYQGGEVQKQCLKTLRLLNKGQTCVEENLGQMAWRIATLNPTEELQLCLTTYTDTYFGIEYDSDLDYTKIALADCVVQHESEYSQEIYDAYAEIVDEGLGPIIGKYCLYVNYDSYDNYCGDESGFIDGDIDENEIVVGDQPSTRATGYDLLVESAGDNAIFEDIFLTDMEICLESNLLSKSYTGEIEVEVQTEKEDGTEYDSSKFVANVTELSSLNCIDVSSDFGSVEFDENLDSFVVNVIVDPNDLIQEKDETNNEYSVELTNENLPIYTNPGLGGELIVNYDGGIVNYDGGIVNYDGGIVNYDGGIVNDDEECDVLPTCADGIDNDGDGDVDLYDSDCRAWEDSEGSAPTISSAPREEKGFLARFIDWLIWWRD